MQSMTSSSGSGSSAPPRTSNRSSRSPPRTSNRTKTSGGTSSVFSQSFKSVYERSLLEEIQEVLPQSYLIFLLADLRLMSGTGRISTKFESIALDNDAWPKLRAENLAGVVDDDAMASATYCHKMNSKRKFGEGLSPAQIMAVLLLELKETKEEFINQQDSPPTSSKVQEKALNPKDEQFTHYKRNNNSKKKRFGAVEDTMESLLRAYSRMIAHDLIAKVPHDERRASMVAGEISPDIMDRMRNASSFDDSYFESLYDINEAENEDGADDTNKPSVDDSAEVTAHQRNDSADDDGKESTFKIGKSSNSTADGIEGEDLNNKVDDENNEAALRADEGKDLHDRAETENVIGASEKHTIMVGDILPVENVEESKVEVGANDSNGYFPEEDGDVFDMQKFKEEETSAPILNVKKSSGDYLETSMRSKPESQKEKERKEKNDDEDEVGTTTLAGRLQQRRMTLLKRQRSFVKAVNQQRLEIQGEVTRLAAALPNEEKLTQKEIEELMDVFFGMHGEASSVLDKSRTSLEMVQLMKRAVQSRTYGNLRFMSRLFKDGSVCQLLVNSASRIVWMNDWYPLKDLTYAIAVDRPLKRVLVVFRGAITKADWNAVSSFSFAKIDNPVKEDYDGKKEQIGIYAGIYTYLFRKRKDTGTTKYDEIANLVDKYGRAKIGNDYNLFVTGHSLGAALTTLFSFHASCDGRFVRNGPVKSITFGGPCCGGHSFADAFRHQEQHGKLQMVRVYNNNDPVPHLPFGFKLSRRGSYWRHVGIGVQLPPVPTGLYFRILFWKRWTWHPRVFYRGKERGWFSSTGYGFANSVWFHFPWRQFWNFARMHTLFELQDRLMFGTVIKNRGDEFELLQKNLDALYEGLQKTEFTGLQKS